MTEEEQAHALLYPPTYDGSTQHARVAAALRVARNGGACGCGEKLVCSSCLQRAVNCTCHKYADNFPPSDGDVWQTQDGREWKFTGKRGFRGDTMEMTTCLANHYDGYGITGRAFSPDAFTDGTLKFVRSTCDICKGEGQVGASCPEGRSGCFVIHSKRCPTCNGTGQRAGGKP